MSEIAPPTGTRTCIGYHSLIVPQEARISWQNAYVDGQSIRVLPSDGRPLRSQMDRHGQPVELGRIWTEKSTNGWEFAVFETADPGHPFRYELGAASVGDAVVLTVGRHSKSMVSAPSALDGQLVHDTMRAVPAADGYAGPGFCLDGIALEGLDARIGEIVEVTLPGAAETAGLRLNYLGDGSDVPAFGAPGDLPPGFESVRRESASFRHAGQNGIVTVLSEQGRPGARAEAELEGRKNDRSKPHVTLRIGISDGTAEDVRNRALSLIAGLAAR